MIPELELEPCEPAAVVPAQLSGGVRWDADTSGARALMLAVLADAVRCLEQGRWRTHCRARRLAAEAEVWVRSDDRTYPFSFANVTDVLGIDADAVRARLLRVSRTTCPEVRARVVTERSPQAAFRHTDIHAPPPRDRLECSASRVPQRNVNHRKESVMKQQSKKRMALVGFVLAALCASPALAADVHWKHMVGVITATDNPATDTAENFNPVGRVNPATFAWSARDGHARVNLDTGAVDFEVHGLVIIGQVFSGTAGPVQTVTGTLVCNAGAMTEAELDTSDVPIDGQGNAHFSGMLQGIPATCNSPVFLVRIATIANPENPNVARGFWIATGTERDIRN